MSKIAQYMVDFTIGGKMYAPTSKYESMFYELNSLAGSKNRLKIKGQTKIAKKSNENYVERYPQTVYRELGFEMLRIYYGSDDEEKNTASILYSMLINKFDKKEMFEIFAEVKSEQGKHRKMPQSVRAERKNQSFLDVARKHLCIE